MSPGGAVLFRMLLLFAGLLVTAWKLVRRRRERVRGARDPVFYKLRAADLYLRGRSDGQVRRRLVRDGLSPAAADRLTA